MGCQVFIGKMIEAACSLQRPLLRHEPLTVLVATYLFDKKYFKHFLIKYTSFS